MVISFTILSNSRFIATLHLSSNVGRDVLGIPMISRHLFCIDCTSSARYLGKPPYTGEAYARTGCILVQYIVMPISVGRFAFLHSLKNTISCWLSLLSVQHCNSNRLSCCHTSSSLNLDTLSKHESFICKRSGSIEFLQNEIHIFLVFFEFNSMLFVVAQF